MAEPWTREPAPLPAGEVHAVVGVHGGNRLGVAAGGPHGVVGVPDCDVLAVGFGGEDLLRLLSFADTAP